jgi:hypothetical protein
MAFATLRHALRPAPIAALSGLLSLLALSGCAAPSITIREVTLRDQTAEAVALDVQVELRNPADASMRLLQWDYTFSNASGSYSGTWEALTTLPPGELVTRSVPVVLPAAAGTEQWSISGVLSYRSPSRIAEIVYDLGIWRPRTAFAGAASSAQAASAP